MKPVFLAALICACLGVAACDRADDTAVAERPGVARGIDRSHAGQAAPAITLRDDNDEPASLNDAAGPLLVNIWATWCAPCVKELPTLDALARKAGSPRVVLVSQDMGPRASVEAFLDDLKIADAQSWHDPQMALSGALGAQTLPTSILYDASGKEVWRYVGDLDWTGAEAAKLLGEGR